VTWWNGLVRGPAADVGGVGRPVACGQALPGDGDVGADAEGAGKDGGGDLGDELEQRRAAGLAGTDPEGLEPLGEPSVVAARSSSR